MTSPYSWLRTEAGPIGSLENLLQLAQKLKTKGDLRTAATAYDRAYALDPTSPEVAGARRELLDSMSVEEFGIRFQYIPAGAFLMGSDVGDPDEGPIHAVQLDDYWISETAMSWAAFCDIMGWNPPPDGRPQEQSQRSDDLGWSIFGVNKMRLQYCEDATTRAEDWHAHAPLYDFLNMATAGPIDSPKMFGRVQREDPRRPWRYDRKPMVGVSWQEVELMCSQMSSDHVIYRLPTEAEWERAARGARIGCRYPWGDELPTRERCDCDRFLEFSILPMRRLPPNGYGLYAMSGSVWEWTADWYDAEYYRISPTKNPTGPPGGAQRVLRGGSWADCAEVVTVSFRMSRASEVGAIWGGQAAPNIGFRLCRKRLDVVE